MTAKIVHSSGNVFADLGFSQEEALAFRLRSDLMIEVRRVIRERGLKQEKAAELFGVTQPRISDLLRGQLAKFSVDGLVEMLGRAGIEVALSFKPSDICAPVVQELEVESPRQFLVQDTWLPIAPLVGPQKEIAPQLVNADYAHAA